MKLRTITLGVLIIGIHFSGCEKRTTSIFDKGRHYTYQATYIQPNGDTLTNEVIELIPKARPWIFQWSQRAFKIVYHPDTANLLDWKNPRSKRQQISENLKLKSEQKGKEWTGVWVIKHNTGVVENERGIMIHPFRSNQYVYTEVGPFPFVLFSKLQPGESYTSWIKRGKGWGEFAGRSEELYSVIETTSFGLENVKIDSCWSIHAVDTHPHLGESSNDFIFSKEYGFVQMNYTFYNGVRIHFDLIEVDGE